MLYKFFAWIDERGSWQGQKLVTNEAVASLRRFVGHHQHFASTQTYDESGNTLFSPLFADLDSKDERAVLEDTRYVVSLIGDLANVVPDIYFSGNKGFHVIIPFKVEHDRCHMLSRYFFEYLAKDIPSLDKAVYRQRSMFRLPSSPASKAGFFKTQITRDELFKMDMPSIRSLATVRQDRMIDECDISKLSSEFHDVLSEAVANLPKWKDIKTEYAGTFGQEITFCIQKMIDLPTVEGLRNQTCQLLARFFKKCGMGERDAVAFLLDHEHWRHYESDRQSVTRTVGSIYRSARQALVGCKTGRDSDIMRSHCDSLCWFNEKRMQVSFGSSRTKDLPVGWLQPCVSHRETQVQQSGGSLHSEEPAAAAPIRAG